MSAPRSPLRVGLIGYGLAGSAFHAPLIAAEPRLRLASVVTASPERAQRVRAAYPDARVLPDAAALWEVAAEHDVVVVAAPNREHVPLGLAALEAGLHLVVDKPVAPTAAGARLLRDAAAERGLVAAPFHNRRWDGDALTLRALLADGALGRVLRFESSFERWRPRLDAERWRERPAPEDVGGVLYDLGPHLIDQALWLFGPAELVHAELRSERPGARVDDDVFLALAHAARRALAPAREPRDRAAGAADARARQRGRLGQVGGRSAGGCPASRHGPTVAGLRARAARAVRSARQRGTGHAGDRDQAGPIPHVLRAIRKRHPYRRAVSGAVRRRDRGSRDRRGRPFARGPKRVLTQKRIRLRCALSRKPVYRGPRGLG